MLGGNYIFSPKFKTSSLAGSLETTLSGGLSGSLTIGGASSEDLTPNAVGFIGESNYERGSFAGSNVVLQVTGITAATQIFASWSGLSGSVKYRVSNTSINGTDWDTNRGSYLTAANGDSFTVSNNQYVGMVYTNTVDETKSITLKSPTADGTTVATFTGLVYFEPL